MQTFNVDLSQIARHKMEIWCQNEINLSTIQTCGNLHLGFIFKVIIREKGCKDGQQENGRS